MEKNVPTEAKKITLLIHFAEESDNGSGDWQIHFDEIYSSVFSSLQNINENTLHIDDTFNLYHQVAKAYFRKVCIFCVNFQKIPK